MDTRGAWDNMNSDTKRLVVEMWAQYQRTGSSSALEELRAIFKNHGDSDPSERTLSRVL